MFPRVRTDLLVTQIEDELLVFDPASNQAHQLNPTLSQTFQACDGQTPLPEDPESLLALSILSESGLLQQPLPSLKRRAALSTLGKAALAPAILSLVVPAPAAALSGVTEQQCFTGGPSVCGQRCVDILEVRVCAAVLNSPDQRCACVPLAAAATCLPNPCLPYP